MSQKSYNLMIINVLIQYVYATKMEEWNAGILGVKA
jgi:hypothetical protein